MNLHAADWVINILFILLMFGIALYTRRYMRGVADFLAANRLAGRYLLTIASGVGGAISIVAQWEMIYTAGLPTQWWSMMSIPVSLTLTLAGFIIYRFRQTRALTLAQFFEMRYSRNFRIFAGSLCFISGILNYGIFPAVTAHFMMYFFGFPHAIPLGSWELPVFPLVMAVELAVALALTLSGGQITILITEFVQGVLTMIMFVVLIAFLMTKFQWADIMAGASLAPEGKSMIDPLKTGKAEDFNYWYFLIGIFSSIYNFKSWQGSSAYNSAPRTPHEAQMAGILGVWRSFAYALMLLLVPLVAYAVLHLPKFQEIAAPIHAIINGIDDGAVRTQMTVPIVLSQLLPVGLIGLFAAVIIASAVHTDETYLHSWGTILIQDVVLPIRQKPFEPHTHLLLLRLSIVGVALFGFAFSMLFTLKDYIFMFFNLTGAIYLGGAGSVILGGLYWKRGTTQAAWVSMITGSTLAFGGISIQQSWASYVAPWLQRLFPHSAYLQENMDKFPLNGTVIYFYAMLTASLLYVAVSLLGQRRVFDMDKMLHRGRYRVESDQVAEPARRRTLGELLGITPEFTPWDRRLFWLTFGWNMSWWVIFMVGTIAGSLFVAIPLGAWMGFWEMKVWLSFILGTIVTVWLIFGGLRDARQLFRDLARTTANTRDDGTVSAREAAHYEPLDPKA